MRYGTDTGELIQSLSNRTIRVPFPPFPPSIVKQLPLPIAENKDEALRERLQTLPFMVFSLQQVICLLGIYFALRMPRGIYIGRLFSRVNSLKEKTYNLREQISTTDTWKSPKKMACSPPKCLT